jgi:hypothetical protein
MSIILNGSLLEQGTRRAIAAALNRTAADMKKEFIREIQRQYGLTPQGAMYVANTRMSVIRATMQSLKAIIRPSSRVIPLILFNAEQTPAMPGAAVEILRGQKEIVPHAFIATGLKSGKKNVFRRIGATRMPITVLQGVPFRQMFSKVMPAIDEKVRPNLNINLQKELTKTMR